MNFSNMKPGTRVMGAISIIVSFRPAERSFENRLQGYGS